MSIYNQKNYYTVYCTTNLVNMKIYIGVHKTRDIYDGYLGSGNNISSAIKKYGRHNFDKAILYVFNTSKEAYKKEAELVSKTHQSSSNVYNISEGGWGNSDRKIKKDKRRNPMPKYVREKIATSKRGISRSESTKRKLSIANKGKKHSKETIEKMRLVHEGTIISPETRRKIALSKIGKPRPKHVRQRASETHRGSLSPLAKLSEANVIEMKKLLRDGARVVDMARKYHVNPSTISNIKHGRAWKHVQ